jgi:Chaperone of endosialidase
MANGTKKNIQDIKVWDILKWSKGNNTVLDLIHKNHKWLIYSFNGGKHFVTDSHPFMTTKWWKSINPEETAKLDPGIKVTKLEIWDILIIENWQTKLEALDGKDLPQKVYTFTVDGTHDYYADGYLVHNKYAWINWSCPTGWMPAGWAKYDRRYSYSTLWWNNCVWRDLWTPILVWPAATGGVGVGIDKDIMSMIYWDKNKNGTFDNGTDRSLLIPMYATSSSGNSWDPYYLDPQIYFSAWSFRWNNGLNLSYIGTYSYWVSQGSSVWNNLMSQWFTANNPISASQYIGTGWWYVTWLQIWLNYDCNGSGTQTVSFIEYQCPSWYNRYWSSCYTWSVVTGWPCTANTDCTTPWTCNWYSYTPANSVFKYSDAGTWNNSHSHWNDRPHGWVWYCRNWDPAYWCLPNNPDQNPNWFGGWTLCGCWNFIPNNDSTTTYGTCTTSSSTTIPATEVTATDTVTCSWTGGTWSSCVSNWTCNVWYTLTWDTNGNWTPNCLKTSCTTVLSWWTVYNYQYNRQEPAPINASCSAGEDWYSQSCGSSFWNINCGISETATQDVYLEYTFRNGWQVCTVPVTISNGSSTATTTAVCGCAIAGSPEWESVSVTSPTNMNGKRFSQYFIWQTSTGVDISSDISSCWCDNGVWEDCSVSTGVIQVDGTYGYCNDIVYNWSQFDYNIFGHNTPQTSNTPQTVCSTDNQEATDTNNCSGCSITTESPTACDLNDPLMAWVCYIPGGYGTTLLVTNGMVGINTLTPWMPLDVEWTIRAAQVLTLSDARLKSSIEKIDNALEKIREINGYSFTWKKDGTPDLWVLAQEIEKVFADAVSTDTNGKKTVQYSALLAPIIEAIKELNTHIDTLSHEKFDNQVKRIEAIEEKMK